MKKTILSVAFALFLAGCTHTAQYNKNAETAPINENIQIEKALQSTIIYVSSEQFKSQKFKASSRLGNDESVSINYKFNHKQRSKLAKFARTSYHTKY